MRGKRVLALVLIGLLSLSVISTVSAAPIFDLTEKNSGLVKVNYSESERQTKILIQKDEISYYYQLRGEEGSFPLQLGSGDYRLSLLEQIEGNRYRIIHSTKVAADISDERIPFLQSAQPVEWQEDMETVKLARSLVEGLESAEEKAAALYEYIVHDFTYDKKKAASSLSPDYLPDVEETLVSKKGICYDYAVLFAVMARSSGIPAKVVMGYHPDVSGYHAWNEVYLPQEGGWVVVDLTYDLSMVERGIQETMIKKGEAFQKTKEY
ncbi:MAG TPA: transglutaminase domain-containing protein [Clostridia bacterium]|nr:transglutaminase domain-containing protein [Clostridia bacterium]